MSKLDIRIEQSGAGGAAILRCRGDIDADTCESLDKAISRLLKEGCTRIAVDLSRVPFMSSLGIGVLIGSGREADERGGAFALINPSRGLKEIFRVTGFDTTFLIVRSDREALEYFGVGEAARGAPPGGPGA